MTNTRVPEFDATVAYKVGDIYHRVITPTWTVFMQVTEVDADGRPIQGMEIPADRAELIWNSKR